MDQNTATLVFGGSQQASSWHVSSYLPQLFAAGRSLCVTVNDV